MNVKKIVGTATLAGALGAAALGLGVGTAQADPWVPWVPDIPGVPGVGDWVDVNPFPPGQVKNAMCPWFPPGHWTGGPHGPPCI